MSSLTDFSDNKIFNDQENEIDYVSSTQNLPTPSPNRSKYEGKIGKRRPLGEKTNKNNEKIFGIKEIVASKTEENKDKKEKFKEEKEKENDQNQEQQKKIEETSTSVLASSVSFQDLFHLNNNNHHQKYELSEKSDSNTKIEELSLALSETLQENEQLHDSISLLKAEIERLNTELLEQNEYAELYMLSKELIENQAEEIESLKKKLKAE